MQQPQWMIRALASAHVFSRQGDYSMGEAFTSTWIDTLPASA